MPKLSENQQSQRRSRILDAAEACFANTGFHRTSMQDICQSAGVSAGAVYLYFDSKEALITGISERDRAEIIENFTELAGAPDFAAGMREVMRSCILERPPHKSRLYLAIAAEATHNPAVARALSDCDSAIRGALAGILRRAEADGRIAPAIPVERIINLMSVIADGLFWRGAVMPGFDLAAAAADLLELVGSLLTRRDAQSSLENRAAE